MNADDRRATETELASWLEASAPALEADVAARMIARTRGTAQRGAASWTPWLLRTAGAAAAVAVAVAVGLGLSRLIGPPPQTGTPPPAVTSATPSASPAASDSPEASAAPAAPQPGRIAFQGNRANETSGIYLMDADGSNVVQLVDDPAIHETDPVWSPDGSLIAYLTMAADGSARGGVFVIDPDGGEPQGVAGGLAYGAPTWSPDGSMLALGGDGGAPSGISIWTPGELQQLTFDGGTAPHWSPDGTRIAYNVSGPNDVAVLDLRGGTTVRLTSDAANDTVGRWTDDGARIVFASDRGTGGTKGEQRSWVVDAAGGEPELLGDRFEAFAWWPSPDGVWLAYGAADGLHVSRADGSEDRLVQSGLPGDQGPSWAANSSAIVFSGTGEEPRELWMMAVDAAEPVRLTDDPADDSAPSWGPGTP